MTSRRTRSLLGCMLATALSLPPLPAQSGLRWRIDLEADIRFQKLLDEDLLLVGTERHVYAVRSSDGGVVWRLRNVSVFSDQIQAVPGTRLLLLHEGWGGRFQDRQSSVMAVDSSDGRVVWESPTVRQQILAVAPDLDNRRLLLVSAEKPHGKGSLKRALSLILVDASSGVLRWRAELGRKVRLSPRPRTDQRKDGKQRGFDLSAYRSPVFDRDRVFVFYDGVRCYEVASGRLAWFAKLDLLEDDLALSYADPFLEGDVLYLAVRGRLWAFDTRTGQVLWKSNDFGTITELYFDDQRIYARLGGVYLDLDGENWKKKGPYGVVVIDRARGRKIWRWGGGDDGITNLMIFGDRVYLADRDDLYALDRFTGKRLYKRGHGFEEAPHHVGLNERTQLILAGPQDVAAFEYGDGRRLWRQHLPPPGVGIWKKLAAGLLGTTGVVFSVAAFGLSVEQGLLPAVPAPLNRVFGYRGRLRRWTGGVGIGLIRSSGGLLRISDFTRLEGRHQYFFTRLPQGGKGLVGVDLNTGVLHHQLPLRESDDRVAIDEGRALAFDPEGSRLAAYRLEGEFRD